MYGIVSAPAIWQREIKTLLRDIPEVTVFLDDIKITDTNEIEHLHSLEAIFKRSREKGVRR